MSILERVALNTVTEPALPWRVLRVKTGREFEVSNSLDGMGFETYCPKLVCTRKFKISQKIASQNYTRAMFDGYTIARIEPDARLDRLARRGLLYHVFFQHALSEPQVEFIRVAELEATALISRRVTIRPGDYCTVMVGVLKNEPVEVLAVRKRKLLVKLTRFGARSAPVSMPLEAVQ